MRRSVREKDCSQENCEKAARFSYLWPGDRDRHYACVDHIRQAQGLARVMGFTLCVKVIQPQTPSADELEREAASRWKADHPESAELAAAEQFDFATLQRRIDDLFERVAAIETKGDVGRDQEEVGDGYAKVLARVESLERETKARAEAVFALVERVRKMEEASEKDAKDAAECLELHNETFNQVLSRVEALEREATANARAIVALSEDARKLKEK